MVLPAAIKRVLSLCTPVPTAALHGPRTAAAREAVPVCDGCKRPSANLMVNEFGVTCAACCMHAARRRRRAVRALRRPLRRGADERTARVLRVPVR